MNCRPGDLAVVVAGSPAANVGKVIRVVELDDGLHWTYEGRLLGHFGTPAKVVADDCLRPLRDSDGQDETLSWKEVPKVDFLEWRAA
jgi:hypothetical protein